MGRPLGLVLLLLPLLAAGQQPQEEQFNQAGVCARCHVISVVEWGMSGHRKAGTDCAGCHGASQGHVADERNNIKPDRIATGDAVAGLCASCHSGGCPKTGRTASCQSCHHAHALINPDRPPEVAGDALEEKARQWELYAELMKKGEVLFRDGQWPKAQETFQAALNAKRGDRRAAERLKACKYRLAGGLPGFELTGGDFDERTGLPRNVRVSGRGIAMLLVSGDEFEMGSERFPGTKPVHTVRVEPYYLAVHELTRAEWEALMGTPPGDEENGQNPRSAKLPVTQISWEDARLFTRKLNEQVPGGGFRLPTEAEWEFAARAGWDEGVVLEERAWFAGSKPQPVGAKKPDRRGFFDMQGNVWEWCSSLSKPYPYDPLDGREAPEASGLRILRGGGFADSPDLLDPAMRHSERPDRRLRWNGIRLARSVPEP